MRVGRIVLIALCVLVALLGIAWGTAALWIDGPSTRWLAGLLAALFALGAIAALLMVRPV